VSLIVRYQLPGDDAVHLGIADGARIHELTGLDLDGLLQRRLPEIREQVQRAMDSAGGSVDAVDARLLAPVAGQEVWAAGVTYLRSRDARLEESGGSDVYAQVYVSDRPELFFKSPGWRVSGPTDPIGVRADSEWNVPEPELAVVVNAHREIVGYTVGNDVSSRDIEGANPLYLPQAKVYDHSCALGPGIRPAWELPDRPTFELSLAVCREGATITEGAVSTTAMARTVEDLVDWLGAALTFPVGAVLLTGTGIVPDSAVSLREGDEVTISGSDLGRLHNVVRVVGERVGPPSPAASTAARAVIRAP
jgi:2-dehydro-3-deoxy-D-arabinonate dehydratase